MKKTEINFLGHVAHPYIEWVFLCNFFYVPLISICFGQTKCGLCKRDVFLFLLFFGESQKSVGTKKKRESWIQQNIREFVPISLLALGPFFSITLKALGQF